ncbi:MAG: hypothetical protein MMC23_008373 [Stictis urceolatum]|nr:hypothetical protein [Stictis urceolata]
MNINSLLNSSDQAPRHSRTPSVPSPYPQPSAPFSGHQWNSSPDPPHQLAPPNTTANAPYTISEPSAHRTSRAYSAPLSAPTSPALSTISSADPSSPQSSRSSPPTPDSPPQDIQHLQEQPSSASSRERREFRPTYKQEEEYFIWFHRVDLGLDWTEIRTAYNSQFPNRTRRGFQGIQCKYYRCCYSHGIPPVRERNRAGSNAGNGKPKFGVRDMMPQLWYPWMDTRKTGRY